MDHKFKGYITAKKFYEVQKIILGMKPYSSVVLGPKEIEWAACASIQSLYTTD